MLEGVEVIVLAIFVQLLRMEPTKLGHDPFERLYPDVRKCCKGMPQNVSASLERLSPVNVECLRNLNVSVATMDPLCFKVCVLKKAMVILLQPYPLREDSWEKSEKGSVLHRDVISKREKKEAIVFNYSITADHATEQLLRFYVEQFEVQSKRTSAARKQSFHRIYARLQKCENFSFSILKGEQRDCLNLSPARRQQMEKLVNCIDAAVNC